MTVSNLAAHYTRLLTRWPKDLLRPEERHFQRLLQSRIRDPSSQTSTEANAGYLLLDNTFTTRYHLSDKIMKPASDPGHYERLAREIEEGPKRGVLDRVWKRVSGMIRMK